MKRSARRRISDSLEKTKAALAKKREESTADKKAAARKPKPQSGDQSFQKPESRKEVKSQPHRAKGTKFLDPSRRAYEVSEAGELRAVNKPPSREKRRREERNRKNESD
jgi:hypothetical protein